ncbi:thiazolylpeptide-type bacteriocin [Streptacidiphilus sp. P02-A3a]|uniref:thiazolylpeptide-type bacteriocin n=1 Tax=Streptacidiphilus sp. P02-A3a TaxID=2704468 RepID=UPI0015F9A70F|nr:thiazolylpeptide-type bacteriocin [Streptacidiphilus sp. P02-A3a]QMU71737.1 thiazolylpeptide-type bacteriocin [Streptacidiphilus sp. P02-A3a]
MPSNNTELASLTQEILELESDTFEITDFAEAGEVMNGTCSSTCSSCCGASKN